MCKQPAILAPARGCSLFCIPFSAIKPGIQLQPTQFLFFQAAAGNIFHFTTKGKFVYSSM
jgi:hypothetical protein